MYSYMLYSIPNHTNIYHKPTSTNPCLLLPDRRPHPTRPPIPNAQPTHLNMFLPPHFPRSIPINRILKPQKQITSHLENTAHLERPRDLARRSKEPKHLHEVTSDPGCEDRETEAFAGARAVVGEDLGEREGCFDGEAQVAD